MVDASTNTIYLVNGVGLATTGTQTMLHIVQSAFFNGLPPTAFGYLMQGCAKFGGYELLKQQVFGRMRAAGA